MCAYDLIVKHMPSAGLEETVFWFHLNNKHSTRQSAALTARGTESSKKKYRQCNNYSWHKRPDCHWGEGTKRRLADKIFRGCAMEGQDITSDNSGALWLMRGSYVGSSTELQLLLYHYVPQSPLYIYLYSRSPNKIVL